MIWRMLAGLTAVCTLPALAQISRPQLGLMLDSGGGLRPVYGVPASTTLDEPLVTGVLSASCSAQLCLAKTPDTLWSYSRVTSQMKTASAPAGLAVFAFNDTGAFIYFPNTATLVQWSDGNLTPLPFRPDGEVLSLRATGDGLDYALRRNQVTSVEHISISSGSVSLMSSQGSTGPVALLDNGTLITSANGTKLVRGDGSEVAFPVTAIQSLSWLGEQFLQATTAEANWVIRVAVGSEQAFLLPGVAPPVERAPARPERPRRPAQLSRGGVIQ